MHSARQNKRAEAAKELYEAINFPSLRDCKHIISTNKIQNCPVTVDDINVIEKIYGPNVFIIKGKTTRKKPRQVIDDHVEAPQELLEAHKSIDMSIDVLWIEEVPFLNAISHHVKNIVTHYGI